MKMILWITAGIVVIGCLGGLITAETKETHLGRPLTRREFLDEFTAGCVIGGFWGAPFGFVCGSFTKRSSRVILTWMAVGVLAAGTCCGAEGFYAPVRNRPKARTKEQLIRDTINGITGGVFLGILVGGLVGISLVPTVVTFQPL